MRQPLDEVDVLLAEAFDSSVEAAFPDKKVDVTVVASACASLLGSYFTRLKPLDRIQILHDTMEVIIGYERNYPDRDLLLQH